MLMNLCLFSIQMGRELGLLVLDSLQQMSAGEFGLKRKRWATRQIQRESRESKRIDMWLRAHWFQVKYLHDKTMKGPRGYN